MHELGIMPFPQMRSFFDITTFNKILVTGKPVNLATQIQRERERETREAREGLVRISGIPRTERMRKSYLYRACTEYNSIQRELKQLGEIKFSKFRDCMKKFLMGLPYEAGVAERPRDPGG